MSSGPDLRLRAAGLLPLSLAEGRLEILSGQASSDRLLGDLPSGDQGVHLDSGVDVKTVEHEDEIFGRQISGGARRIWTPSQPSDARVNGTDSGGQADQGVCQRRATRIVQVQRELRRLEVLEQAFEDDRGLAGGAHADRVADAQLM